VTLAQLNLPNKTFWNQYSFLLWISTGVLACFVLVETIHSVDFMLRARQLRDFRENLRALSTAVIAEVVDSTGAPWDEVGVRLYRRRGIGTRQRLALMLATKAGADTDEDLRSIKMGQHVAGVACTERVRIAEQWAEFIRIATDQGPAAWDSRSASQRYGLNWGQMRRSASAAPGGVVASPTFNADGEVDGVIIITGPLKMADLAAEPMRRTLDDVAGTLDRLGPPPRGWWAANER
jgi:hypothetical protein